MKATIRATKVDTMTLDFINQKHLDEFVTALRNVGVEVEVVSQE